MTGAIGLILRCKTLKPLSDEQRERWRDLLSAFEGETGDKTHATLLLAEVLGALDDAPAVFVCLLRDAGMGWEQLHYEITTPHFCYHYEWLERMSDSWQSSDCEYYVHELRGLPPGVLAEVSSNHALEPTYTVTLRGVSLEAAERVEKSVRGLFVWVRRASDRKKATR